VWAHARAPAVPAGRRMDRSMCCATGTCRRSDGRCTETRTATFPAGKDSDLATAARWAASRLLAVRLRRPDRPRHPPTDAHHRIERGTRPPMRCAGRRGRPPQLLQACGRRLVAQHCAPASQRCGAGRGHASLRTLLRDTRQEGADLSLPVPAVTAKRADRREFACLCPPGDCLRVNPEHRRDFGWR